MAHHCLTVKYPARAQAIVTPCHLCVAYSPTGVPNPLPEKRQYDAVWDTGATGSVITQRVADELALTATGITKVHHADGESETETYLVNITLPNGVMFHGLRVTRATLTGFDVLIGMDVIGNGDFALTNVDGKTVMSYRIPSKTTLDFSAEENLEAQRRAMVKNRPNAARKKKNKKR